ncbi:hypothetical protein METBIDRAFT_29278 [Metschnikowia bicuspidata var. bicuspidata NRRL YB-4993]|uniref:Uncharacterized protein n=1 Tax=Metschnikowia bicuspidata var. bicuspidata NRRL YB-4993 TaxID=869754 RepID=A0A1A0HEY6_9ASCO|nr:hypothetical protein METBIDRAFT_29278 [Metschnikowia bicuspidata var. bicuspidata NRRL YB-4993]OBA22684.1 hypothetical protein METBIDRAFT_29278 [Metschnikowia bicuspidata var. bicuspidata NRRL YB-4993]
MTCESIDGEGLVLIQDFTQNLLPESSRDAGEDPHLGSKQVGTEVEMSDILVPDISDDGWKVQGRKRRSSRKRPEPSVIMATTRGSDLLDQKGFLGSNPSMKQPSSNLNPFLVLAEISEEDFQQATLRRYLPLKN